MAELLARRLRWRTIQKINRYSNTAAVKVEPVIAARASEHQQKSGPGKARSYLPGATVATLGMCGVLQARRLYDEKQIELAEEKGIEPEFSPDTKASFLQLLPLRLISRAWGSITSVDLPAWSRPFVYKTWARAFHTDLDDVPLPLEEYASLRDFFTRGLKDGTRVIETAENCMVSPVDGVVMRYGRVIQPGAKVEQVKGFTYSLSGLLGDEPHVMKVEGKEDSPRSSRSIFSFWRSQAVKKPKEPRPPRELFYCVLYLAPGDYHRVHSPSNFCVQKRAYFPGNLFPVNARATRTIKDLYVVNERIVLQGDWQEGYMAVALVGATNMGSIQLKFEPSLETNQAEPVTLLPTPQYCVKKGEEIATFNMGSTVILVFEAPGAVEDLFNVLQDPYQGFRFTVSKGQRVRMGQSLGQY